MNAEKNALNTVDFAEDEETSIDLVAILAAIKQKIGFVIAAFIIGAVLMGTYTKMFIPYQYRASSMIYIYSKTTSVTSLTDLQIGRTLTVDFQILATTRGVLDNVAETLGLDWNYDQLRSHISVTSPSESHILKIDVVDTDPVRATDICNTLSKELRMQIADVMNTDEPSSMERAYLPEYPIGPNATGNAIMGGIVCAAIVSAIIVLMYLMDDHIRSSDDIMKYLLLNTLAEIPFDRTRSQDDDRKKKDTRKNAG